MHYRAGRLQLASQHSQHTQTFPTFPIRTNACACARALDSSLITLTGRVVVAGIHGAHAAAGCGDACAAKLGRRRPHHLGRVARRGTIAGRVVVVGVDLGGRGRERGGGRTGARRGVQADVGAGGDGGGDKGTTRVRGQGGWCRGSGDGGDGCGLCVWEGCWPMGQQQQAGMPAGAGPPSCHARGQGPGSRRRASPAGPQGKSHNATTSPRRRRPRLAGCRPTAHLGVPGVGDVVPGLLPVREVLAGAGVVEGALGHQAARPLLRAGLQGGRPGESGRVVAGAHAVVELQDAAGGARAPGAVGGGDGGRGGCGLGCG